MAISVVMWGGVGLVSGRVRVIVVVRRMWWGVLVRRRVGIVGRRACVTTHSV